MAIYNLNQTGLNTLLAGHVSASTEAAIIAALEAAHLYPSDGHGHRHGGDGDNRGRGGSALNWNSWRGDGHGRGHGGGGDHGGSLRTDVEANTGAVTINEAKGVRFFFEEGDNTTVTLQHTGRLVGATGDGAVTLDDFGNGHDTLVGGAGAEKLVVHQGANELIAGSGRDTLVAGAGADTLIGGGRSVLQAGSGHDKIVTAAGGSDTIYGGAGSDKVQIGAGANDQFYGANGCDDICITRSGNDTIFGGAHTTVHIDQRLNGATITALGGGVTQIVFGNGQTLDVKSAEIIFKDGHLKIT